MAKKLETIKTDITPDKTIYETLGRGQHQLSSALLELIDNSWEARLPDQIHGKNKLQIQINIPLTTKTDDTKHLYGDYIEVIDNAAGMSKKDAQTAIVLAKKMKENKLGGYGLGLKHSCLSIGQKFTIESKQKGVKEKYVIRYDNQEFQERGEWNNFPVEVYSVENPDDWPGFKEGEDPLQWHGTIVRIEKFWNKKLIYYEKIKYSLISDIGFRVGPFLLDNSIEIKINNFAVVPQQYEVIKKIPLEFKLSQGKVTGWVGFLKEQGSTKGYGGFNLFVHGRLITAHQHIGYRWHAELRKLVGELHFSEVPISFVTIDKKDINRESPIWYELVGREKEERGIPTGEYDGEGILDQKLEPILREYRKTELGERKIRKDNKQEKKEQFRMEERKAKMKSLLEKISDKKGETVVERYISSLKPQNMKTIVDEKKEMEKEIQGFKELKPEEKKELEEKVVYSTIFERREIKIGYEEYTFEHHIKPLAVDGPWYEYVLDKKNKRITITSNGENRMYLDTGKDDRTYFNLIILIALGEAIADAKGEGKDKALDYFKRLIVSYSIEKEIQDRKRTISEQIRDIAKKAGEVKPVDYQY